ncbi:MAG: CBS domain-containing protein [Aigarchaeota archaeon]|nr:CBS domain-containing protein [Aigarchaeota archaeon]MDW8093169.1 CBS domain-containing protein [Nitrososphaerota archaeon]
MLKEIKVGDITVRNPITIDELSTVLSAAKSMDEHNIGSLVVTRNGEPVSIVTERDLLRKVLAQGRDPNRTLVKEVMSESPITVDSEKSLEEAVELMNKKRVRRLLVTERGRITGILTQRDIVGLNRLCRHCGSEIIPPLESLGVKEPYVECTCGDRYHLNCARSVVYCLDCSQKIVTEVIYPEPSETMSG